MSIHPLDPAEVARVREARAAAYEQQDELINAARMGEITMKDLDERGARIAWPHWSRWTIGACPPKCALEHGPSDGLDDQVAHEVFIANIPSTQPAQLVRVWWGFIDELVEGTRSMPEVQVSGADDGLSPQGARLLGDALFEAAAAVEAWQEAQR